MTAIIRLEPCNCGLHTRFCIYLENKTVVWATFTGTTQLEVLAAAIGKRINEVKPLEKQWVDEATAEGLSIFGKEKV